METLKVYILFLTIFSYAKKRKTTEIWRNKNAKNLEILLLTLPHVDDQIKDIVLFFDTPEPDIFPYTMTEHSTTRHINKKKTLIDKKR